jgi:hypothetical protein
VILLSIIAVMGGNMGFLEHESERRRSMARREAIPNKRGAF